MFVLRIVFVDNLFFCIFSENKKSTELIRTDISKLGKQMNKQFNELKITSITNQEIEYNIIRENIKISHVSSEVLENNIGYIKISSFEGGCSAEFLNKYKWNYI